MAGKTFVGGTEYDITAGKTLVGGTAYDITAGKTLVGGTAYDIDVGGYKGPINFRDLVDDMYRRFDYSRNSSSRASVYIYTQASNFTSNTAYYLFGFVDGYCCVYKYKDGILSALAGTNENIQITLETSTNIDEISYVRFFIDSSGSSGLWYGGSIIVVTFPSYSDYEDAVDYILKYSIYTRLAGRESSGVGYYLYTDAWYTGDEYLFITAAYGDGNTEDTGAGYSKTGLCFWTAELYNNDHWFYIVKQLRSDYDGGAGILSDGENNYLGIQGTLYGASILLVQSATYDPNLSYYYTLENTGSYGWVLSSATNPDSTKYDGVYESTNEGVNSSYSVVKITFYGYLIFKIYIRSYAESNYDYTIASTLDAASYPTVYADATVQASTRGNQQSGMAISNYTAVTYNNDGGEHYIYVVYRKDSSDASGDDKGYFLIDKDPTT